MTAEPQATYTAPNVDPALSRRKFLRPFCFDRRDAVQHGNFTIYADADKLVSVHATVDARYTNGGPGALPGEGTPDVRIHCAIIGNLLLNADAVELAFGDLTDDFVEAWRTGDHY